MVLLSSDPAVLPLKKKYPMKELNNIMNSIYPLFIKNPQEYSQMLGIFLVSPLRVVSSIEKEALSNQGKDVSAVPKVGISRFRIIVATLASIVVRYIFTSGIFESSEKAGRKGYVYLGLLSGLNLFMKSLDGKLVYYFDDNNDAWLYDGPVFFNAKLFVEQCLQGYALQHPVDEQEKEFVQEFIDMPFDKQELYIRGFLDMLFSYFKFKEEPIVLQIYAR